MWIKDINVKIFMKVNEDDDCDDIFIENEREKL